MTPPVLCAHHGCVARAVHPRHGAEAPTCDAHATWAQRLVAAGYVVASDDAVPPVLAAALPRRWA